MIIGYLNLEIYLPYSHSLKEKRKRLKGLKDRLRINYNVSYSELEFLDKWQRTRIGLVTINNQKIVIDKIFKQIIQEIEINLDGEIINKYVDYY